MTTSELAFLIIGIATGVTACVIVGLLRRRVQRVLALRNAQIRHSEELAEKRARHLRSRTEQATGKNGWELDVETVYAALFSENGFDDQLPNYLLDVHREQSKRQS